MIRLTAFGTFACISGFATAALGAGPLGQNGEPIRTSNYAVDLMQGPVLASTRVTGLAGAYVAIAEGVDASSQTPVSPGVRPAYSVDHFDYDLALGLSLPATLTSTDFFNTGGGTTELANAEQEGFVFVSPALNLQWGKFGVGLSFEIQNYSLTRGTSDPMANADRLNAQFVVAHLQLAHMFFDGQLVLGVGTRALTLTVINENAPTAEQDLFTTRGAGVEVGALLMLRNQPFRIGAAFRSAVTTEADADATGLEVQSDGDLVAPDESDPTNAFWLPERASLPWDLNVGLAIQLGPRPFNPRWVDPAERIDRAERALQSRAAERRYRRDLELRRLGGGDRAARALDAQREIDQTMDELYVERVEEETRSALKTRYAQMARRYVLISMSLVVTGAVEEAVGVESFLQRVVDRSGRRIVYSPRLGVETEIVPNWLKVRAGAYGEPSRFSAGTDRLHGTLGFDAKLFPWTVFGLFEEGTQWRFGAVLDAARRYLGWGISLGVWH